MYQFLHIGGTMTTFKKTIVLNNSQNNNFNGSAILTLAKDGNSTYGTLKTFNITSKPNLVLGLAQNNKQVFICIHPNVSFNLTKQQSNHILS